MSAIIEAEDPLSAVAFLGSLVKSALQVSGQDGVFDLSGAVVRVAPANEAERIYEMTDDHGVLPPRESPGC